MLHHVDDFDPALLDDVAFVKRGRGNQGGKAKRKIKNIVCAFDIECTNLLEHNGMAFENAVMYSWAFQFGLGHTIIGRTWEEFVQLLEGLRDRLADQETLVVYVHNLSYEFQFLRGIYRFDPEEVFAVKSRKILKCTMWEGRIEFRCSYMQTNQSLEMLTKNMAVEHQKMSGEEFDYKKIRFPWTPLSDDEWKYQIHDVLGLVESMEKRLRLEGDTLETIPLTSTGYVRRDAKKAMRYVGASYIRSQFPTPEFYEVLREAFRGGDTHANRYYTGMLLRDVKSVDIASSYPAQQCTKKFPVSYFYRVDHDIDWNELIRLITVRKRAVICRIAFEGLRLRNERWGFPYLSKSKCRCVPIKADPAYWYDNGRVLKAAYLETTVTDIDLAIIAEQYTWDGYAIIDCYHARYGYLPKTLIDCTLQYFATKTQLKGTDMDEETVYNYLRCKALLNAIFGMTAQDPAKDALEFWEDGKNNAIKEGRIEANPIKAGENDIFVPKGEPLAAILEKQAGKAFLLYQWGVYITAHARAALQEGLVAAGENAVYCDTDSVKYVGEVDFSDINNFRTELAKAARACATDKNGKELYMGLFEPDGVYKRFVTWGAKKYAYEDTKLHVTIAGVSKKHGAKFLADHGGLEALKPGFIFSGEAGGTEAVFNDDADFWIEIDGHQLHITKNVCLCPSTYKLGLQGEYERLIRYCADSLDSPC